MTVGGNNNYTQTGGSTTVDGSFAAGSPGQFSINAGSVFGNGGTFSGNVVSGGTFNIGDALLKAGQLGISGNYTQSSAGNLAFDIGGLAAGTLFDQFDLSGVANLGGTLNLDLINKFVPTIGSTFDVMNFSSETGNFAAINGTAINGSEHFQVVINPTNITLDVVAGPGALGMRGALPADSLVGVRDAAPSPTPEPSSLLLLASATLAGATVRYNRVSRRRRGDKGSSQGRAV